MRKKKKRILATRRERERERKNEKRKRVKKRMRYKDGTAWRLNCGTCLVFFVRFFSGFILRLPSDLGSNQRTMTTRSKNIVQWSQKAKNIGKKKKKKTTEKTTIHCFFIRLKSLFFLRDDGAGGRKSEFYRNFFSASTSPKSTHFPVFHKRLN